MPETWISFSQNGTREGRYLVGIETHESRDEIFFSVPAGFFAHNDSVAAALATLCGKKYKSIKFNFPVSAACSEAVRQRTGANVSAAAKGSERQPGHNIGLNFSGGFDSLASYLLAPEQIRVAVAFGSWFEREREFVETLKPGIICTTDFRQKGYERNDWIFMFAVSLLFADYLALGAVGLGTIFEATVWNYRFSRAKASIPLFDAIGLRDATLTRGLTEFGTAQLMLHYAPELIDGSIISLAPAKSEKRLRKRLLIDATRHRAGGPQPDFDRYEYPKDKLTYGESYPVDFLALLFLRLYGPQLVSRWMDGLDKLDLMALDQIDVGWIYRYNPLFYEDIPGELREGVVRRMRSAAIEPFKETDWPHYRALRDVLTKFHRFDGEGERRP